MVSLIPSFISVRSIFWPNQAFQGARGLFWVVSEDEAIFTPKRLSQLSVAPVSHHCATGLVLGSKQEWEAKIITPETIALTAKGRQFNECNNTNKVQYTNKKKYPAGS